MIIAIIFFLACIFMVLVFTGILLAWWKVILVIALLMAGDRWIRAQRRKNAAQKEEVI